MNPESITSLVMFGLTVSTPFAIEGAHRQYLRKHGRPSPRREG